MSPGRHRAVEESEFALSSASADDGGLVLTQEDPPNRVAAATPTASAPIRPTVDVAPRWRVISGADRSHMLSFVLGLSAAVPLMKFTITGFSFACVILTLLYSQRLLNRRLGWPLLLVGLGSLGYLVSAILTGTSVMAPNFFAFPAVGVYLCGLMVLARRLSDLFAVLVGACLGTVVFYGLIGTVLTAGGSPADLWKYGLATPATVIVLVLVSARRRDGHWAGIAALAVLALGSVALNFRSHALICTVAIIFLVVDRWRGRPVALGVKALVGAAVALAGSAAFKVLAGAGLLGSALTEKIEMQAEQKVPTLLAGRTEPPLSLTAIARHPLVGWGEADRIGTDTFDRARDLAVRWGFDPSFPFEYVWRLPNGSVSLHSIVLGSWAEAGVLTLAATLCVGWAAVTLVRTAPRIARWSVVLTFLGIQTIWDLLFSPWSYNLPLVFAAVIAAALLATSSSDRDVGAIR